MAIFKKEEEHKTEKEKLEERREEILATGRKFKYPMQYAKHKMVFITVTIALVALVAASVLGWAELYKFQNTGDILYRITMAVPLPVARIDGEKVKYSDYLMLYRSSIAPIEQQNGPLGDDEDAEGLKTYYKRAALTAAEDYTYAMKLARQLNVDVTDEMVDQAFSEHRELGGTERSMESFLKVLKDNFDLSEAEYRRLLYLSLVKVEVGKKIDTEALAKAEEVENRLKENGGDLRAVASDLELEYESTNDLIDVMNVDGGRSSAAYKLQPGEISNRFLSSNGDGYYYVKLNNKSDGKVSYESIRIPFTELDRRLSAAREENRVEEYITIEI